MEKKKKSTGDKLNEKVEKINRSIDHKINKVSSKLKKEVLLGCLIGQVGQVGAPSWMLSSMRMALRAIFFICNKLIFNTI